MPAISLTAIIFLLMVAVNFADAPAHADDGLAMGREDGPPGVIDAGPGPGLPLSEAVHAEVAPEFSEVPAAGPDAHLRGAFGPARPWPIIAMHAVLLPDGRVLNYGSNQQGVQGAHLEYAVWDPRLGTGPASHLVLPNTTATDIFCSGQSVLPESGQVFLPGGDATIGGIRGFSNARTTIFDPKANEMRSGQSMVFKRWYPTVVPLRSGNKLVLGGREDKGPTPVRTPEIFLKDGSWRLLPGATSEAAFGVVSGNWWYPRAWPARDGRVFVLGNQGRMFFVTTAGDGSITQLPQRVQTAAFNLPAVMFASGRILALRSAQKVLVIDINGDQPKTSLARDIGQMRFWSNTTVLPDGQVLVSGGSAVGNQLRGVAYAAEIWSPATGLWTRAAAASRPRLYHSTAMLLPDASVLTAGGGSPGPVRNLNAEIYYPPYLYRRDGSGRPAVRPTIVDAPDSLRIGDARFPVRVGGNDQIGRVVLLRNGSVTHALDVEQTFQQLSFTQTGSSLSVAAPSNLNITLPGYYMLFAISNTGVPSVAKIIRVLG